MTLHAHSPVGEVARCWAAFACLGAGLIHLAVVHQHLAQWRLAGVFFVLVGVTQVGWAIAALARRTVPAAGITATASLALVALWGVTRTTGLPFGPDAGTAEPVGTADVLCVVLQMTTVVLVLVSAAVSGRGNPPSRDPSPGLKLALLGAGALVMAALTTPALAATDAGAHAHPHFERNSSRPG